MTESDPRPKSAQSRPKILFLIAEDWYFFSHRLPIARAALQKGWEVTIATRVREHGQRILNEGFRLIPLTLRRESYSPLAELEAIRELRQLYQREQPDIVHHVGIKPVLYGSIAALRRKIKVVNALAGLGYLASDSTFKAKLLRLGVWNAFRFLLKSANSQNLLQNNEDGEFVVNKLKICRDKITIIRGSGVDTECFQPSPEPIGKAVVVLASRMLWNKGVREFVDAARLLIKRGIVARFVLVGASDPESPSNIPARQLQEWQEAAWIEFWGHQDDMPQVFRSATVVCLPSYREGLPKVLLEAAACGRPIVASDVPGCREIVRHGVNGILVPPKSAAHLAEAIQTLLENRPMRLQMGCRGREIAVGEFSEKIVVEQTLQLYENLLSSGPLPKPARQKSISRGISNSR